ncbi:MAG: hypothetical protein AB7F31_01310 [Parachlamydiales bacterium]
MDSTINSEKAVTGLIVVAPTVVSTLLGWSPLLVSPTLLAAGYIIDKKNIKDPVHYSNLTLIGFNLGRSLLGARFSPFGAQIDLLMLAGLGAGACYLNWPATKSLAGK